MPRPSAGIPLEQALQGCLLGTALGDALGLACEGLSPARQKRLFPDLSRFHFLPGGRGMVSDDTEHLCLVAQALLRSGGQAPAFQRHLAWQLKLWLLGLPAGIGLATLKGILRLWLGFSPEHSGVFSAGNGPAMRATLLGVLYGEQPKTLKALNRISSRLTHTDPKAEWGALAIAQAAYSAWAGHAPETYLSQWQALVCEEASPVLPPEAEELQRLLARALERALPMRGAAPAAQAAALQAFLNELGCAKGITGYMYHTVPSVIFVWMLQPNDVFSGLQLLIRAGGDTDTTAALLGGILGASGGPQALPEALLQRLWEWPRSPAWMLQAGKQLALMLSRAEPQAPLAWAIWQLPLRNGIFLLAVLLHGFRRLFPPF